MGVSVLLEAVVRWLIRLYGDHRTRNWPTVKGEVQSSEVSGSSVVVVYHYRVDKNRLTGTHERTFTFRFSAEEYAKRFPANWDLVVRYIGPARV